MPPLSSSDFTVAMAGLDLLPATRLKVACSLLAADHLIVRLVQWGAEPATLLVADETSHAGRHAIQMARQDQVPSIRLNGAPHTSEAISALPKQATVRDFADALKSSLQTASTGAIAAPSAWDAPLPHPLLEHLRLDRRRDKRVLLELGLFRIVSDTHNGQVHMLRRMPLDELLERALKPDWRITELSEKDWELAFRPDVTRTYAIETLWWQLLPHLDFNDLPKVTDTLRLRTWPDLDAETTPASWTLILAHLVYRRWQASELAAITTASVTDVQQVTALIRLSGLEALPSDRSIGMRASAVRHTNTLLKMAKRFGLKFFGKAHG